MRVFVTGAAGFIGSRLSRALLERGDEVVGFDNLHDYYPVRHKERNLGDLRPEPGFTFVRGDLRDAPLLRELFERHRPDAVAHLGGLAAVRYSIEHPLPYGEVNVQGSMNLLEAARHGGTRPRIVLASTGSVYGADTPVPFLESAPADRPLAAYPASKRAMELFGHTYHHLWGLPVTVVRFFNVYGPHGRPDMMPWRWTQQILAGEPLTLFDGGRIRRDWTYVDDIVAGLLRVLEADLGYEILNLGRGRPVENLEFVRILETLLGRSARIVDAPAPASEPQITYASVEKARRLVGYDPAVSVEEGLSRFVAWLRAEGLIGAH